MSGCLDLASEKIILAGGGGWYLHQNYLKTVGEFNKWANSKFGNGPSQEEHMPRLVYEFAVWFIISWEEYGFLWFCRQVLAYSKIADNCQHANKCHNNITPYILHDNFFFYISCEVLLTFTFLIEMFHNDCDKFFNSSVFSMFMTCFMSRVLPSWICSHFKYLTRCDWTKITFH